MGADVLTVRRLGAALGADPSALYWYSRNTDDLLLAVTDELIGRAQPGWKPTGEWRTGLCELGLCVHASHQAHPQVALLAAHRTTGRDKEIRAVEMILGVLRSAGFPNREAVRIYYAFVDQALAFAALDAAALALSAPAQAADLQVRQDRYGRLEASACPPHRRHCAPAGRRHDAQWLSVRARAAARRCRSQAVRGRWGGRLRPDQALSPSAPPGAQAGRIAAGHLTAASNPGERAILGQRC